MTANFLTAIFFMRKIIMKKPKLSDFRMKSIYEKFLCDGKIGIGVILYEKGKGKFVGDWKNPPHRNCKQTKGNFLFSLYAAKLSN